MVSVRVPGNRKILLESIMLRFVVPTWKKSGNISVFFLFFVNIETKDIVLHMKSFNIHERYVVPIALAYF